MSQSARKKSTPPALAIFELLMGEWVARSIHVAANLNLADYLKDGPKNVQELAQATNTNEDALYRLLRSLASQGIFEETEAGVFAQTDLSAALRSDLPGSIHPLVKMYGSEWQWKTWGDLEYSIQTGKAAAEHILGQKLWEFLRSNPTDARLFQQALASTSKIVNEAIVSAYDFSSFGTLVDVGGGFGSLLQFILGAYPHVKGVLFERPQVIEGVRERITPAMQERIELVGGDFFVSVPAHADAYIMKQVLHDWSDEDCIKILKVCHEAMESRAKILIMDTVIQPGGGPETSFSKLADLLMLVIHAGRERTSTEFIALLESTGFRFERVIQTGTPIGIIEGTRM